MPADNVHSQLASQNKRLLDKLLSNDELSSVVMGLLGRIIYVCEVDLNRPVMGVDFGPLVVDGGWESCVMKSQIFFHHVAVARAAIWHPKNDFQEYVGLKAGRMARALSDNPRMGRFFQELAEALDRFAEFKGIPFKELRFDGHIITRDNLIILEVGRVGRAVGNPYR